MMTLRPPLSMPDSTASRNCCRFPAMSWPSTETMTVSPSLRLCTLMCPSPIAAPNERRQSEPVPFAQEVGVVALVPGDDVAQGANGDRVAAGNSAPRHLLVTQISEKMHRGGANRLEFVD